MDFKSIKRRIYMQVEGLIFDELTGPKESVRSLIGDGVLYNSMRWNSQYMSKFSGLTDKGLIKYDI